MLRSLTLVSSAAGFALGGVCRAAGVSGFGRLEKRTDVSWVEVWGNAVGARCSTLRHQRTECR